MRSLRLNRLAIPLMIAMVLAVVLPLIVGNKANAAPGFVTTSGTKFMLDGKPFYVAGTNSHYLGWGTRAEVDSVLGYDDASNYNVVRGILHSVTGSLDGTTKPHIWNPRDPGDASNMGMHGTYLIYWDTATNTYAFNPSTINGLRALGLRHRQGRRTRPEARHLDDGLLAVGGRHPADQLSGTSRVTTAPATPSATRSSTATPAPSSCTRTGSTSCSTAPTASPA